MTGEGHDALLDEVAAYYASKLAQHGPTPQGVDWNGEASHQLRHRQFLRLIENAPDASVLDLGCGFGDFLRFIRAHGHRGPFIGYDVAPSMIDECSRLHGEGSDRRWCLGAEPDLTADFAIASGIFNVMRGAVPADWKVYVWDNIRLLARAGRRGFGFNMLSTSSDPQRRRPDLHYADPIETLAACLSCFGPSIALLQDYGLYEFTVLIRTGNRT